MKIVLDTDKKTITVPWNYAEKLAAIRATAEQFNDNLDEAQKKALSFDGYIDAIWRECMANTDKCLRTADKPKSKK